METSRRNRPTIGVLTGWQVYTGIIDSFLEHVIRGIQAAASARDCNLLLACGTSSAASFGVSRPGWPIIDERVDFLPVGPWNCDGLIITPTMAVRACEQYIEALTATGYPLVFAGLQGFGPGVAINNTLGIQQAMHHLYEHGHRRIAFLAGFDNDPKGDSGVRLQVYRQTLADLGLPFEEDLVAYGFHDHEKGQQAMRQVMERKVPFSAVLASNDLTAMGAMEELRQAGFQIPQDVALIGFDNRVETRGQSPPLTTVHFPMFELGFQSVEMVLDCIEGRVHPHEIRLIPTDLVIRESCGCLPGETGKVPRKVGVLNLVGKELSPNGSENSSSPALRQAHKLADESRIEQKIAAIIQTESHRMRRYNATLLTRRCIKALRLSLAMADPQIFLNVFQEVLDQVADWQNDLFIWQYAITVLRDSPTLFADTLLKPEEVDDMLDQARVMASESARAQLTRLTIKQTEISERLKVMTNRFFVAQDEDEIFNILNDFLPSIGIEKYAVLYLKPQGDDPNALSALQSPHPRFEKGYLFDTYQFPPPDLFDYSTPLHLALLPITIGKERTGYIAFKIGPLEPPADIVRQLEASLHGVRLRQAAIEGHRLAEEANRMKSRFLSMVSHELRAPLNLITGLCDIIIKDTGDKRDPHVPWDDLERIYGSAQHLDSLIQDVLDLTLSDVGQLKLTCEPLNIREVLDSVAEICKNVIREKGLTWRFEAPESLPRVWGDRTRLRQVTLNLLNNAIKFTEHGEVALKVGVTEQGLVAVSVSDTGLGIPLSEQDFIFQEFFQSERTAARGYGGLGLGLAICRRLVELHGGEISVTSSGKKNQGAEFTYTLLPINDQPTALPALIGSDKAARVLLLVKSEKSSALLQRFLAEQGHEVGLLMIGAENDWFSRVLIYNPDAVVLDLETTSERGWDVLKAIKDNPETQDIPVLFYALSNDGQSGSFLEMNYMTKPVKGALLADALYHHHLLDCTTDQGIAPMVLVVDDDPHTVDLHARLILSDFPTVRIRKAYNGREALEIIQEETPALVLLDLLMPEVDGFEVLNTMRANKNSQAIPVIVITSQSLNHEDIFQLNQGVVTILGKTIFSKAEVMQHISTFLLDGRQRSAETQQVIMKAMGFIHSNYKESISRQDIASSVCLSERHLDRCFQRDLGISPITYLNRYRVYQARNLLDSSRIGITAVAMEVGFSSSGYFARVFRSEMGISPRDYVNNKIRNLSD